MVRSGKVKLEKSLFKLFCQVHSSLRGEKVENIVKKLIEYCERNVGTGTLILVGIFVTNLFNKSFVNNLPIIGSFRFSNSEIKSCLTLLSIIMWILLIKLLIQLVLNRNYGNFDADTHLPGFAKKMVFCSWAFLLVLIFDKNLVILEFLRMDHLFWGFINYLPVFVCFIIVIGACFKGAFSENE